MEALSVAVLVALASGLGGSAGAEAWQRLSDLVRRPFRSGAGSTDDGDVPPTRGALRRLQSRPDAATAQDLLNALDERSAADADFAHALSAWATRLQASNVSFGEVRIRSLHVRQHP